MSTRQGRRRPRRALRTMLALAGLVAAGACGIVDDTSNNRDDLVTDTIPRSGGRLVVAVPAESNGWNPFINQWTDAITLVGTNIIEALAVQDNDGQARPWLADGWEAEANFTEWTISVRPGVVFHDGTKLDAAAVKKNLDVSLKSGFHQVVANVYRSIDVVAPMKVRVRLTVPWAQYPASLANEWVMAPSMIDRPDGGVRNPVGTGPFRFTSWEEGKALRTRRFERYWRRDAQNRPLPYLDQLEFRPMPDDRLRESALRTHQVDVALSNVGSIVTNLEDEFTVIRDYRGQRTFLMLNTAVGPGNEGNPFTNVHARRALAYATDRRRVAELAGEGVESTTYGYRPDSPWAPAGADGYVAFDPDRAREEVAAFKRDTGARDLSFSVLALSSGESLTILQALRAMWADVGIRAEITGVDAAKQTLLTALGTYQASWFRFHDFPDPDQTRFLYMADNIRPVGEICVAFNHYTSRTLEANLEIVRENPDFAARKAANDAIIRETNDQVLNVWLYDTPASIIAARHVQGLDGFRTHAFANNLPKPWMAEAWLRPNR